MPSSTIANDTGNERRHSLRGDELLLRYASVVALCFWMGGFTFYAGVVIHVGHHVFGSAREVGFLTKEVTLWLNRSAVMALVILCLNYLFQLKDASRLVRWVALGTLLVMAGIQVVLFQQHLRLDELLDVASKTISNPSLFRQRHNLYMNLSTVQWSAALLHLWAVLVGWSTFGRATAKQKDASGFSG